MKVLRGIAAGLALGIISWITAWPIYGIWFADAIANFSRLWRPMDSPHWTIGMPLANLFAGLTASLGFAILYKGIPGTGLIKGLVFGLILLLMSRIPGEIYWYLMSPVPFSLLLAGWLHGLFTMILGGLALAAIYGRSLE